MTTEQEYWDDVRTDAESIVEDLQKAIAEEDIYRDHQVTDFIFDRLDIQYVGSCEEVMSYTSNPDALHDQGEGPTGSSWNSDCHQYAVAAHREDLRDKTHEQIGDIDDFIAEYRPEDQDEDEEPEETPVQRATPPRASRPGPPTQEEREAEERKRQEKFFFGKRKLVNLKSWK